MDIKDKRGAMRDVREMREEKRREEPIFVKNRCWLLWALSFYLRSFPFPGHQTKDFLKEMRKCPRERSMED